MAVRSFTSPPPIAPIANIPANMVNTTVAMPICHTMSGQKVISLAIQNTGAPNAMARFNLLDMRRLLISVIAATISAIANPPQSK